MSHPSVNTGIDETNRREVADVLCRLLADTYALYLKTQNFHWNVTGRHFHSFHALFQEEYEELSTAIDTIAERIRSLGFWAPGSFSEFKALTEIAEAKGRYSAKEMVQQLLEDHEKIIQTCRNSFKAAENAEDEVSVDLLVERLDAHEKTAWMLRSTLDD